jgi:hypothetical protein
MNYVGGGFIPIINYSSIAESILEEFSLMTENNLDILTESGSFILTG